MKKYSLMIAFTFLILTLSFAGLVLADPVHMWRGSGGWGPGSHFHSFFNPKTVETITGEVTRIDEVRPMKGMSHGVHLMLKTDKEELSVHLGPTWFIENQDVKIDLKDQLEIKGSRVQLARKPALIASEIRKGDEVMTLRDENGLPVWSGWRKGGPR